MNEPTSGEALTGVAPSAITQAMMARYLELAPLVAECKALRKQIVDGLEQGAVVEPGPLAAQVVFRQYHRLNVPYLLEQLGVAADRIAALREAAPLFTSRCLCVTTKPTAWSRGVRPDTDR